MPQTHLETAMHEHNGQAHYAPASVGALIDTGFLRHAAMEANDERRAERARPSALRRRLSEAMRTLAAALRRH